MSNRNEWDGIIQEEIENMICRLRDRGVNADKFEITIKGQRMEEKIIDNSFDNDDIETPDEDAFLDLLNNLQKNRKNEKYKICDKCGERVLESEIHEFKDMNVCDECIVNDIKESIGFDNDVDEREQFLSFLRTLKAAANIFEKEEENKQQQQKKKRKRKEEKNDKNED